MSNVGVCILIFYSQAYEDVEENLTDIQIPCRYYNAFALYHQKDLGVQFVEDGMAAWTPGKEDLPKKVGDGLLKYYNSAVNQALASDSDEDDVVEEDSGVFGVENQDLEYDCVVDGNEVYDFFGIKRDEFTPKVPDFHVSSPLKDSEDSNSRPPAHASSSLKPKKICAKSATEQGSVSFLVPNVTWHQTDSLLILKIAVPDIIQYELNVIDKNTISFQTLGIKPKDYGFNVKVFGKLEPQFDVNLTGLCMTVKFKKKMGGAIWPRVLYSRNEKFHWLKEDLDYLKDDMEGESKATQSTIDPSMLQGIEKLNMTGEADTFDEEFDDDEGDVLGGGSSYGVDLDEFSDSDEYE